MMLMRASQPCVWAGLTTTAGMISWQAAAMTLAALAVSGVLQPDTRRDRRAGGSVIPGRLHPVMHVWSKTVTALTAETLLGLFQEAVDLRPPNPRTGLW